MDKNFIITGGASGIGKAIVRSHLSVQIKTYDLDIFSHILSRGGKVFLTDINEQSGLKTRQELSKEYGDTNVGFHVHDVTSADSWVQVWDAAESFFSGHGGVQVG